MSRLPEIIAEIGVNYYDIAAMREITPLDAAMMMVREAKDAGVSIVKFQTYNSEKLAAVDSPAYWDLNEEPTRSQRELFSKYDKLTFRDFKHIAEYCVEIDAEFMSTPFDAENATLINELVKRHKIASADITNIELLSLIGSFRKPVILSAGASTKSEIQNAITILRKSGAEDITLLHCVLNYPTPIEKSNLWKIPVLKGTFDGIKVGYSDHTKYNLDVLTTAWLLGAEIIEKHFTLDKTLKGNDHYHAATPDDMKELLLHFENTRVMIGEELQNWYDPSEEIARKYARRGVYLKRDVKAGEYLKMEDVEFLRPQDTGISPVEWYDRIERKKKYSVDYYRGQQIR